MQKLPPIEKFYEAYSAVADGRVEMNEYGSQGSARVRSSDGTKVYDVTWKPDGSYSSTDNATRWQRYPGYPILAVMMLRGQLPYDQDVALQFSDVNWTQLNNTYRRDYAAAVDSVIAERGIDPLPVHEAAAAAYAHLQTFPWKVAR